MAPSDVLIREMLRRIEQVQKFHTLLLKLALKQELKMADTLDDVINDIQTMSTVEEGVAAVVDQSIALLDDIKAKLDAGGLDATKLAAIRSSIASNTAALAAKKDEIAAAVVRDTPAAT